VSLKHCWHKLERAECFDFLALSPLQVFFEGKLPMSDLDLSKLNDRNPSHWTDSGEPSLAAVKAIVGRAVTREEVRATGRMRNRPGAAKQEVDHAREIAAASLNTQHQIQRIAEIKLRLKAADAKVAEKHAEIMRVSPPPSVEENIRAHLAALAKHAPAAPIEAKPASKLDAVMSGAGRRAARDVTGNARKPARGVR
jgi:hypothetical protein